MKVTALNKIKAAVLGLIEYNNIDGEDILKLLDENTEHEKNQIIRAYQMGYSNGTKESKEIGDIIDESEKYYKSIYDNNTFRTIYMDISGNFNPKVQSDGTPVYYKDKSIGEAYTYNMIDKLIINLTLDSDIYTEIVGLDLNPILDKNNTIIGFLIK